MVESPSPSSRFYEQLLASVDQGLADGPTPRNSASVVPWRRNDVGDVEVFWVRRSPKLRFMGGWHAFPGGGLSKHDVPVEVHGSAAGASERQRSLASPRGEIVQQLPPDLQPGLLACALRELFEETGLLLTRETLALDAEELDAGRREELDKDVFFSHLLQRWQVQLDASRLVFAGRWLTPPLAPRRFDNRFFLLHWPAGESIQPSIIPGELAEGEWITAAAGLEQWQRSTILTAPPIVHLLRVLAEDGPEDGLERLRHPVETCWGPMRDVEFRPQIHLLPLRTPTLPPATHTNAFLLGQRQMVLIDPATPFTSEQDRLLEALRVVQDRGATIQAIWLTHHHIDHIGAVERVRREFDLPVLAHAASEAPLEALGIPLDGELRHGQRVVLDGDPPCTITVHHTPGHASGHLCFWVEDSRSLIAGDLVSALSTIVIDPPDGDMGAYLNSLEVMLHLEPDVLFPAHGPVIIDGVGKLDQFYRHRQEREAQVLELWRQGIHETAALVQAIYTELPEIAHAIAERQVLAHLKHLQQRGEIELTR